MSETEVDMILTVQRVGDRTFALRSGVWIEEGLSPESKPDMKIGFLSEEYFQFAERYPEVAKILKLGEEIVFLWKGKIVSIILS